LRADVVTEICHGPSRIDEYDVARSELHRLIVLGHRRFSRDLKQSIIMLHAVEANIPLRPFHPASIPTNVHRCEPAYIQGARPAEKGVGFDTFRAVPPANPAEQSSPRLEIQ